MMKKGLIKILLIAIILILIALPFSYLITSYGSFQQSSKTSITDILGRNITLPSKVERIVAIGPGMLRLVCYLNATDLVVGVEESELKWGFIGRDYAMAYGDLFKNLSIIGPGGPGKPPVPELIIAVKPDVIIMSRTYCDFYDPDRLQKEVNATVIVMDYGQAGQLDIEGICNALSTLGKVLNREERADQLINFIKSIQIELNERTKDISPRPKVYVGAVSYKGAQPFTSTQSPFPPLSLLNTKSIADNYTKTTGFVNLDFEVIIHEQPNIIFIDEGNLQTVIMDFNKDPNKYLQLDAFKEGKVYGTLPYNYYHTNIATALADAYYIGKILYPEKFKDIDPEKKANEIFQVFIGKPIYQAYADAYGGFKCLSDIFKVQ
ncbi:MAG: ABC transporter substrate-binding protein [Candidatus Verstraetearchaeota archaeon]|nr:ABC transporter substrate-binding protein [Candidatus Verstraetearchaeota archaeon]